MASSTETKLNQTKYSSLPVFAYIVQLDKYIPALAQSAAAGEYTDCISAQTIWWCGSSNTGALGNAEYPLIATAFRFTLARSGNTWKGPIYGSNRIVWHLNWVQTNDLC